VGINAQVNNFDLNIDADTIPAAYDPNSYIQYQFTTAAFTNQAELTGFGAPLKTLLVCGELGEIGGVGRLGTTGLSVCG